MAQRPPRGDSYVLPLSDAAAIAHARDLVSNGPSAGRTIAVASIAKGADGINRDVLAPDMRPWSWHVTRFEAFADVTIEVLDGWPGFVEQDVDAWIANTGGMIGFWSYTVVRELGPIPEPSGALLVLGCMLMLGVRRESQRKQSLRWG
jgi:hypothetical protein